MPFRDVRDVKEFRLQWPLKDKGFLVLGEQGLELKNHGLGEENKIWI